MTICVPILSLSGFILTKRDMILSSNGLKMGKFLFYLTVSDLLCLQKDHLWAYFGHKETKMRPYNEKYFDRLLFALRGICCVDALHLHINIVKHIFVGIWLRIPWKRLNRELSIVLWESCYILREVIFDEGKLTG